MQEINTRGWGALAHPPEHINIDIIQEFYANAKPIKDVPFARLSWVRGKMIVLKETPFTFILKVIMRLILRDCIFLLEN